MSDTSSKEYWCWARIIQRCENPDHISYKRYGQRGISVCARWRHSYETFLADMGRAPTAWHTIERRENDGDYEPANCRWATRKEQAQNRCTSKLIRYRGQTLTMAQWADHLGVSRKCLWKRLHMGWSLEKVLTSLHTSPVPLAA